jgi:nucleotide-binding universal stress UspA family protein
MTGWEWMIVGVIAGLGAALIIPTLQSRPSGVAQATNGERRIVFPFVGTSLTTRALEAAIRLARVEGATLVPVYLAIVPMHLDLSAALPRQSSFATGLLEAIDQKASRQGVPVDTRIERGRTVRHAMQMLCQHEDFFRMVVASATRESDGLDPEDVAWALRYMPGEIIAVRPGAEPIADQIPELTRAGRLRSALSRPEARIPSGIRAAHG